MANVGFFLGGMAQNQLANRELGQKDRALTQQDRVIGQTDRSLGQADRRLGQEDKRFGLASRAQAFTEKTAELAALQDRFQKNVDLLTETSAAVNADLEARGVPVEQRGPAIRAALEPITLSMQDSLFDPIISQANRGRIIDNAATATASAEQVAAGEGRAKVAGVNAVFDALGTDRPPISTPEAKLLAGVEAPPAADIPTVVNMRQHDTNNFASFMSNETEQIRKATQLGFGVTSDLPSELDVKMQLFNMPDGTTRTVDTSNAAEMAAAAKAGGEPFSLSVSAPDRASAITPTSSDPKAIIKAKSDLRSLAGNLEELKSTAQAFAENPAAGGFLGFGSEKIGGALEQFPLLDKMVEAAGIDPAEAQRVRSLGRATVATMLQTITKEDSKFTKDERKIASETLAALEPTSSTGQIAAAFDTAVRITTRESRRKLDELRVAEGLSAKDLATPEGIDKLVEILAANGVVSEEDQDEIVHNLLDSMGL